MIAQVMVFCGSKAIKSDKGAVIAGKTTKQGQPTRAAVMLIGRNDMSIIERRRSQPNGDYQFNFVSRGQEYMVISRDIAGQYNAVAADRITPVEVEDGN